MLQKNSEYVRLQVLIKELAPAVVEHPEATDQEEMLLITTESSAPAHPSTPTTTIERIAEAVEQELARVRRARPALASRISRAESIIVSHLSCRRARVIRVRVRDGHARFLVSGSGGAVYVVDPADWSCTCPDHHRRGGGCKHSIACWALRRASARPALAAGGMEIVGRAVPALLCSCASCSVRLTVGELVEVGPEQAEHSLEVREGERYCRACARRHGVL